MSTPAEYHPGRIAGVGYLFVSLMALFFVFGGPAPMSDPGFGDSLYFLLIALHYIWGVALVFERGRFRRQRLRRFLIVPEFLGAYSLMLFLFAWVFALNANMDYVQRFVEAGGDLRLALDTRTERAIAALRYGPFLAVNALHYLVVRFRWPRLMVVSASRPLIAASDSDADRFRPAGVWGLMLVLLAVLLSTISFPSFIRLDGLGPVGFFSLTPLFLAVRGSSYRRSVFLVVTYGTLTTLLVNYWLGTFSLVSLQISVLVFFCFYLLFVLPALWFYKRITVARFLVFPLAWTAFELMRSSGFLGYPWALVGHSQYGFLPLIQLATVTGVWGVSFVVLLVNSALAELVAGLIRRRFDPVPIVSAAVVLVLTVVVGSIALARASAGDIDRSVRIALIQQNSDPRKHNYDDTFASLRRLTDSALEHEPEIVAWSETAFVPNIRRWGEEDPRYNAFARLVRDFRDYQRSTGTWLLTGNDDYARVRDDDGREIDRNHFNAAVFFSETGERRETYHKIRLVPFTEHFPYEHIFPRVHQLLQDFDVHFWEPGTERVVFEHPRVRFSTPICFEDVFPDEVRRFVLAGTELILNISNDYWSLTEVQAKQHFAAGMFRAVENRRPLVRSTASGLTAHVDRYGRVLETLPYYEEAYLLVDVEIPERLRTTVYTRFGDWFPIGTVGALFVLVGISAWVNRAARRSPRRADSDAAASDPSSPADPS